MQTAAAERKSSRTVKKPDFFVPPATAPITGRLNSDTEDAGDSDGGRKVIRKGAVRARFVGSTNTNAQAEAEAGDVDGDPKPKPTKSVTHKSTQLKIIGGSILDKVLHGRWHAADSQRLVETLKDNRVAEVVGLVNFVLKCAGADGKAPAAGSNKVGDGVIASDVDLDGLDNEEISELLSDAIHALDDAYPTPAAARAMIYPLLSSNKTTKGLRAAFRSFWEDLGTELRGGGDADKHGSQGLDVLHVLVTVLTSLSSMCVVSIRDAATEAVLALSRSIRVGCVELRGKLATTQRQLAAEKGHSSGAGSSRYQAMLKNKNRVESAYKALVAMNDEVYQSVLLHRYRDASETIRSAAAHHLGEWMCCDVAETLRDEFLKYIGWMCSERSVAVRRAAVGALAKVVKKSGDSAHKLQNFVERFLPRFIEMAVADIDEAVQFEMMGVLRLLQRRGLLDSVSEEVLDSVDDVVFDSEASPRLRRECMAFVMDHTEGFDFVGGAEEGDVAAGSSSSGSAKTGRPSKKDSALSTTPAQAAANRRRNALLLESLTEFVQHHLQMFMAAEAEAEEEAQEKQRAANGKGKNQRGKAKGGKKAPASQKDVDSDQRSSRMLSEIKTMTALVVEAVSSLPQGVILADWAAMTAMLLRDNTSSGAGSNMLLTAPLSPLQASILTHIFVGSAMAVRNRRRRRSGERSRTAWSLEVIDSVGGADAATSAASDDASWASLMQTLSAPDFLKLLVRCKEDGSSVAALSLLLQCMDGSVSLKGWQACFKFVTEAFEATAVAVPSASAGGAGSAATCSVVLQSLARVLSKWSRTTAGQDQKGAQALGVSKTADSSMEATAALAALSISSASGGRVGSSEAVVDVKITSLVCGGIADTVSHLWEEVVRCGDDIESWGEKEQAQAQGRQSKGKGKKSAGAAPVDRSASLYALHAAVCKLALLQRGIDCTEQHGDGGEANVLSIFGNEELSTVAVPKLVAIIEHAVQLAGEPQLLSQTSSQSSRGSTGSSGRSSLSAGSAVAFALGGVCVSIARSAADVLFCWMVWKTRGVYCDVTQCAALDRSLRTARANLRSLQQQTVPKKGTSAATSFNNKMQQQEALVGSLTGKKTDREESIESGIAMVQELREMLETALLVPWMCMQGPETVEEEVQGAEEQQLVLQQSLRQYAFRMANDLRVLYPHRLADDAKIIRRRHRDRDADGEEEGDDEAEGSVDVSMSSHGSRSSRGVGVDAEDTVGVYRHVRLLAYAPSQDTLHAMRSAFEAEQASVQRLLDEQLEAEGTGESDGDTDGGNTDDESASSASEAVLSVAARKTQEMLLNNLLLPLAKPLLYDVEHLNRRQASAVLPYLVSLSSGGPVEATILAWLRRLKAANLTKFLEVLLVALKTFYESNIADVIQMQVEQGTQAEEELDDDDQDLQGALERNYAALSEFAFRLASTVSANKIVPSGPTAPGGGNAGLVQGLESFIHACIDYALSSIAAGRQGAAGQTALQCATLGFFDVIDAFLYLLPNDSIRSCMEHLSARLGEDLPDEENDPEDGQMGGAGVTIGEVLALEIEREQPEIAKPNREIQSYADFRGKLARKRISLQTSGASRANHHRHSNVGASPSRHPASGAPGAAWSAPRRPASRPVAVVNRSHRGPTPSQRNGSDADGDDEGEAEGALQRGRRGAAAVAGGKASGGATAQGGSSTRSGSAAGRRLEEIPEEDEAERGTSSSSSSSNARGTTRSQRSGAPASAAVAGSPARSGPNKRVRRGNNTAVASQGSAAGSGGEESSGSDAEAFAALPTTGTRKRNR